MMVPIGNSRFDAGNRLKEAKQAKKKASLFRRYNAESERDCRGDHDPPEPIVESSAGKRDL